VNAHRVAVVVMLALLAGLPAAANTLVVEPRTVQVDDPIEIVVMLDGEFATVDSIDLPVRNLRIDSGPSVSTEFRWMNGRTSREKTFRYTARGEAEGTAVVGPLLITAGDEELALPSVTVNVLPGITVDGDDPEEALRQLEQAGRTAALLVSEIDRESVWVGEPVQITWSLYTDQPITDLDVISMPAYSDFWSEELPLDDEPTRITSIGGRRMRKIPIRRVALFPLRPGRLTVGPLLIAADISRPYGRRSFFGLERTVERVRLRAPVRAVQVRALPDPDSIDAVGRLSLQCSPPEAPAGGPVTFTVTLRGSGNLRGARPPRFERAVEGRTEAVAGSVEVERGRDRLTMSRRWTFVIFPTVSGKLNIPPVVTRVFDPEAGRAVTLRCGAATVSAVAVPGSPPLPEPSPQPERRRSAPILPLAIAVAVGVSGAFAALWWRRRRVSGDDIDRIVSRWDDPRAMRTELYELVAEKGWTAEELFADHTEAGEAFRSVQSLIDIAEKETLTSTARPEELRRRMVELLRELREGKA
jgi:hypothetical protein